MVTANDKVTNMYYIHPPLQKCCYSFGFLFFSALLKLKPSKKVKTDTSHLTDFHTKRDNYDTLFFNQKNNFPKSFKKIHAMQIL